MEEVRSFDTLSRVSGTLDLRPKPSPSLAPQRPIQPASQPVPQPAGPIIQPGPQFTPPPMPRTVSSVPVAAPIATPTLSDFVSRDVQIDLAVRRNKLVQRGKWVGLAAVLLVGIFQSPLLFHSSKKEASHLPVAAGISTAAADAQHQLPQVNNAPGPTEQAALQQLVDSYVGKQSGPYAVVVKDLTTGATASYRSDVSMDSASLYKLFVAEMVFKRVASGRISMDQRVAGESVRACLSDMITWSDNTCGEALGQLIGWGSVNGELRAEGYTGTDLNTLQQTDAKDVTLLMERVATGQFVDANSTQQMFALLSQQKVNNRLPVKLPGVAIAHKTGDLYSFLHDAGIVQGPHGRYLITVMTGPWSSLNGATDSIAEFSKEVYDFFQANPPK